MSDGIVYIHPICVGCPQGQRLAADTLTHLASGGPIHTAGATPGAAATPGSAAASVGSSTMKSPSKTTQATAGTATTPGGGQDIGSTGSVAVLVPKAMMVAKGAVDGIIQVRAEPSKQTLRTPP